MGIVAGPLPPESGVWRDAGQFASFGGHNIFWREAGDGVPVLLIHGFPTASWDWHCVWGPLGERHRVLCLDMLGFGFSDKPWPHAYRIAGQADLFEALLTARQVTSCHLLAHDYGDTVAQELLARHDAGQTAFEIKSLCFLNGGLFPETHRPRLVQRLLAGPAGGLISRVMSRRRFDQSLRAVFGAASQPSDGEMDNFWAQLNVNNGRAVMPGLIRYMAERVQFRQRWVGALQATSVPLRLIDGTADPVSGAHMVARYRELVPRADVVELTGIGHYPQVEAPARVLEHFLEFVA